VRVQMVAKNLHPWRVHHGTQSAMSPVWMQSSIQHRLDST
jgi:hypothetical protein